MDYDSLKKADLVAKANEFIAAGIVWDVPEMKPEDLNKNELIGWLTANESKVASSPEGTGRTADEAQKAAVADGSVTPLPVQQSPIIPAEDHRPTAVKKAARKAYYHGILVKTVQDQLIGHRIYKDIILENGVGYKLTMEEFNQDVTYADNG